MRMRKKKHGAERIAACSNLLIEDTAHLATDPQYAFPETRPLYIEIGCGKGNFACGTAAANPDHNLIAMERVADVACLALEKAKTRADERPDNLRFLIGDAKNLNDWFPEHCADGLYLNFSDPWPKTGHAKRRLTHRGFLELYRRLLKPNGLLYLKTDNEGLFDFSLDEFAAAGLVIEWQTRDLHASERAANNVMTEYEANFSAKGQPIFSAIVRFVPKEEKEEKNMSIRDLIVAQRSYRSFDERIRIPREKLEEYVDNARLAPASLNIQPLKFRIVWLPTECDAVLAHTRWAAALPEANLPPQGHAPVAYVVICMDTTVTDKTVFARDFGIAAEVIMLSATEDGFGGCMIGSFSPEKITEVLSLPEGIVPNLVVALGKPDEKVTLVDVIDGQTKYYRDKAGNHYVPKRSLEDILL